MPILKPVFIINNTTSLLYSYSIYVIEPASSITLTLPSSTAEGITFLLSRNDADVTKIVTLTTTGGQLIYNNAFSSTSTFDIRISSLTELVSLNGNWYIQKSISSNEQESYPFISTSFIEANTNPYVVVTGAANSFLITNYYDFGINRLPTNIKTSITYISGNVSGYISIASDINPVTPTVYARLLISASSAGTYEFSGIQYVNAFPLSSSFYTIMWEFISGGANAKIGINSVIIV